MISWFLIAAGIVIIDQAAKNLITAFFDANTCVHVIPHLFDFVYVKNTGAAFSILSENTVLLSIISVIFCVGVLVYWLKTKPEHPLMKTALTLLFAGALGNAIDRVFRGFVVDFISTAFMEFPVFNIADISIVFGAILLMIYIIFYDKEEKNGKDSSESNESEQPQA